MDSNQKANDILQTIQTGNHPPKANNHRGHICNQGGSTIMVKRHRLLEGHIEDPPLRASGPFFGRFGSICPAIPDVFY